MTAVSATIDTKKRVTEDISVARFSNYRPDIDGLRGLAV